jgi:hypothetical protein
MAGPVAAPAWPPKSTLKSSAASALRGTESAAAMAMALTFLKTDVFLFLFMCWVGWLFWVNILVSHEAALEDESLFDSPPWACNKIEGIFYAIVA